MTTVKTNQLPSRRRTFSVFEYDVRDRLTKKSPNGFTPILYNYQSPMVFYAIVQGNATGDFEQYRDWLGRNTHYRDKWYSTSYMAYNTAGIFGIGAAAAGPQDGAPANTNGYVIKIERRLRIGRG